ncbi:ATP-dependent RNA helicase DDX42-like [Ctenocephalides felis]|nr:ATP-dependent RNA helicase DDX42-like [Ctenocephalides felis]
MVATDVAARGLDIPHIKTVVNYDIARNIDTHTHRVGRTGRAGEKGVAYTLMSEKDKEFAGHIVRNLEGANQEVPKEVMDLALQSSWFRKSRFKQGKGKKLNVGGVGLGFKERPGMRTSEDTGTNNSYERAIIKPPKGPATSRLSAMKEAFKSQYTSQFKASTDHSWENNVQPQFVPPLAPEPLPIQDNNKRKAKKSRWE